MEQKELERKFYEEFLEKIGNHFKDNEIMTKKQYKGIIVGGIVDIIDEAID